MVFHVRIGTCHASFWKDGYDIPVTSLVLSSWIVGAQFSQHNLSSSNPGSRARFCNIFHPERILSVFRGCSALHNCRTRRTGSKGSHAGQAGKGPIFSTTQVGSKHATDSGMEVQTRAKTSTLLG